MEDTKGMEIRWVPVQSVRRVCIVQDKFMFEKIDIVSMSESVQTSDG
jgi:hypothetical protein